MSRKIVMIDDDQDFIEIHKNILSSNGYDVFCASNGKDGLALIDSVEPDLVILDIMMTSADEGFTVARKIREDERFADLPVIMLSSINKKEAGWQLGPDERWNPVDYFIDKPVDKDLFLNKINDLLNKS